ncbi:hypothetical protein EDD40_2616 [Saccharothrix texasensis]|uniref:Uncharacterized protein n=1 Tax=Saccharothrix texasensis TaxID=103734 RepID=A0A3N1H489_9PSEU|nr:hypothetical protein EDD40_2616 [Saccharothrix texasensis]
MKAGCNWKVATGSTVEVVTINPPARCVYRLVGKRVWDTSGSPAVPVASIFASRKGWFSNLIPRMNPHMTPRVNPQRKPLCV